MNPVRPKTYICVCYILYYITEYWKICTNVYWEFYECDLFNVLNDDIAVYSELGDVYLTDDLNACIGEKYDFGLERFVDMPVDDNVILQKHRYSYD